MSPVPRRLPAVNTRPRPRNAPGKPGAPNPPVGCVQIYCADPPRSLIALLGPEPVKIAAGGGGWELLPRPHQTSATLWQGGEPFLLQLPVMLDDYAERGSVERAVRVLNRIARGDEHTPPGIVELGGIPLPVDEWVIESLDYGDPIRAQNDLRLLRQPVTLMLREYVPAQYVQLRRRRYAAPFRGRTKGVRAKEGETATSLARRVRVHWTDLRELNPGVIVKANEKLKAGQIIYCPPPEVSRRRRVNRRAAAAATRGLD